MNHRSVIVFLLALSIAGCDGTDSTAVPDDIAFQADVPDSQAPREDTVAPADTGADFRPDPGSNDPGFANDVSPGQDIPNDSPGDTTGSSDTVEPPDAEPVDQGPGTDPGMDSNECSHDKDCANGNPCVTGRCVDGECLRDWNQEPCDDGNPCSTNDRCMSGKCVGGPQPDCEDGNACTRNFCKAGIGCASKDVVCDDNNPCTGDSCDPDVGCIHSPSPGPCDDGDLCTVDDRCEEGACVGGDALDCADWDPCTDDWCETGVGCVRATKPECPSNCLDPSDCDDGNPATADICNPWNSRCEHILLPSGVTRCTVATAGVQCSDGDPCTADICLADIGCVSIPVADCSRLCNNESQCYDGDPCTADTCTGQGYCAFVPLQHCGAPCRKASDCLDGNSCTLDICVYDFVSLTSSTCLNMPIPGCTS